MDKTEEMAEKQAKWRLEEIRGGYTCPECLQHVDRGEIHICFLWSDRRDE